MDESTESALDSCDIIAGFSRGVGSEASSETIKGIFCQTRPGARATLEYNGVEFAFRYCPAGSFVMGSPAKESEWIEPGLRRNELQHKVTISEGFWICEVPTTQEQWDAVGCEKADECRFKGAKRPVERVTWYESDGFVKKLNESGVAPDGWRFALPTEEQWEYACRAGTTGKTYGVRLRDCAWYFYNSGGRTHDVGGKKPNRWGIFDLLGNVWEWTSSRYNGGASFVYRGGSWSAVAEFCRPAYRFEAEPSIWYDTMGFRIVLVHSQSTFG